MEGKNNSVEGKKRKKRKRKREKGKEGKRKEMKGMRRRRRKEPVGFPSIDGSLTDGIRQTENQSPSTQRKLRVGTESRRF